MPLVRAYHSLHSKEWERTLPPVSAIKKHQSSFKPWCKRFYALAYTPAGKPPKREGTEYPDLVRGLSPVLSAKPSPLPRVTAPPRRRKKHTPYSAVSASRIHTPFLCTSRRSAKPCSCMPIFICKFIMNSFAKFVNRFTQKNSKNSKNGSAPHRAQGCFTTTYFTLAPYFFETSNPISSNLSTNARMVA